MSDQTYVGRFAPSPTGPLHFGSLIAALGSFLDARAARGHWLVRIEDIDPPREVPGSADAILRALEAHGLDWDDRVLYQSSRLDAYRETVAQLLTTGRAFRCRCSRKLVAAMPGGVYDGRCRTVTVTGSEDHAVRMLTGDEPVGFDDRVQGRYEQRLRRQTGDFVIRRRDRHFAFQLAVSLDDAAQGITDVVRGADLLDSTPRQLHLLRVLGRAGMRYAHLPVVLDRAGQKLSKQHGAAALALDDPSANLHDALRVLDQRPPPGLRHAPPKELLEWAINHWQMSRVQGISAFRLDEARTVLAASNEPIASQQFDL